MSADLFTLAIAVAVCLFSCYALFNNLVKARLIEDTPTSRIRSASQGYVELSGFAKSLDHEILTAPLTRRPCLWFNYSIERYESSGKNSHWRVIERKTSDGLFALEDTTGECAIDPRKADISSMWRQCWRGSSRFPTAGSHSNSSLLSSTLGGRYRYTESIIQERDYLYALGMFQSIHPPSAEQQQAEKTRQILNQWKQEYDTLVARFDADGDGELDMQEWQAARQQAGIEARDQVLANYSDEPLHIMTYSPQRRNPYIISNKDPRQLCRRYRLMAFGMMVLFLGSGGFSIHLFFSSPVFHSG